MTSEADLMRKTLSECPYTGLMVRGWMTPEAIDYIVRELTAAFEAGNRSWLTATAKVMDAQDIIVGRDVPCRVVALAVAELEAAGVELTMDTAADVMMRRDAFPLPEGLRSRIPGDSTPPWPAVGE